MNTVTRLFAATVLFASISTVLPTQADADTSPDAEVDEQANPDGEGVDEPAPGTEPAEDPHAVASGAVDLDYEAIISDLQTSSIAVSDIEAVSAGADVSIVLLSELRAQAGASADSIDAALASLEADMGELRSAIGTNTELTATLDAEGYTADDVVGVTATEEGGLVIIVDDSA